MSGVAGTPGALLHYIAKLREHHVGLACLQEVRSAVETTLVVGGYHLVLAAGERGQLGAAMFFAPSVWSTVCKVWCESARLMIALLSWQDQELILVNVHMPHAGKEQCERVAFLHHVRDMVGQWRQRHPKACLIILGDWNLRLNWADLDDSFAAHDVTSDVGEEALDLATRFDLQPVLPQGQAWHATFFQGRRESRIDHVLASASLTAQLSHLQVCEADDLMLDAPERSGHKPISFYVRGRLKPVRPTGLRVRIGALSHLRHAQNLQHAHANTPLTRSIFCTS